MFAELLDDSLGGGGSTELIATDGGASVDDFLNGAIVKPEDISPLVILAEGEFDPRLMRTSYSGNLSMHTCPRKHQLKCLGAKREADERSQITFAFGHVVGQGIQDIIVGKSWDEVIFELFRGWHAPFDAEDDKQKKSITEAVHCLQQFQALYYNGLLNEYEVAYFEGKPAAEVGFTIKFPHSEFRGFVDLVLRHKMTGELLVLELKTTSMNYVKPAAYKNSAQAIGYSVILDKVEPGCTSYGVMYLVYMTKSCTFEVFEFPKTFHQRALWLRDRIIDEEFIVKLIREEGNYGIWPMYGESCNSYGRDCEFMDICHLDTKNVMQPLREKHYIDISYETGEKAKYDFTITLEELLEAQETISNGEIVWAVSEIDGL